MVNTAEIWLWGKRVGALSWNEKEQLASFGYDPAFIKSGLQIAPLTMPMRSAQQTFSFPALRKQKNENPSTFDGLPGVFADALPDRYGHHLLDQWLVKNGREPGTMSPIEKLCFIGSRGMGALEFRPRYRMQDKQSFQVEMRSLVDEASKILNKKEEFQTSLHDRETEALNELILLGTSAGGARPKAVIAHNELTGEVRSGQAAAGKHFEHWLIKLDGVSDVQLGSSKGWGRVEYAYYLMARDSGIDMMESRLLEEGGRAHFMTKRFDRNKNEKLHAVTWCGLSHRDFNQMDLYSYEELFHTMRALRLTYLEAEQMFRRMVFNVLAKNCDDHTKNFGFTMDKSGKWKLAPAYDICHAYDPSNHWVSQQTLSVNGKRKHIEKSDFMTIAKDNNIREGEDIYNQVRAVVRNWELYAQQVQLDPLMRQRIASNLQV